MLGNSNVPHCVNLEFDRVGWDSAFDDLA